MRIHSGKLKAMMQRAGVDERTLAEALDRPGLDAASALRNWLAGRGEPRARRSDIEQLASALSCAPKDIAIFVSESRYVPTSARKARLVVDLIRGKRVDEAYNALSFCNKRAAKMALRTLRTAIADAEQADADVTKLRVACAWADKAPGLRRFRPKDRGRAHPYRKHKSHIVVGVEEVA